jgi:pilus assembly protein CpaC
MKKISKNVAGNRVFASACLLATAVVCAPTGLAQAETAAPSASAAAPSHTEFATVGSAVELTIGKSTLMRLPSAVGRISVGNPNIADITLISPTELYLLGKNYGSTNLVIWRKGGAATAIDVNVNINVSRMEEKLHELMPEEHGITVHAAADSIILSGVVTSAVKAKYAEDIANAFVRDINRALVLPVMMGASASPMLPNSGQTPTAPNTAKVVNLLQVASGQQVMLEVKVAEVSKTLLDKIGSSVGATSGSGGLTYGIVSNFLSLGNGLFSITGDNGNKVSIDAQMQDGLIKILAEPNIISISGQEASFLAGGKIFIPVSSTNTGGFPTITLEEKEFGVGLKFTPTVLEGGRIHLKVAPEVSELAQTGSAFTTVGGVTSVLPSITTRRAQTTVQLMDGQSLAIAGLIKNNVNETIKKIPLLGDIPVLGALFRSSEFQSDRTELMFVITPRLIKPVDVAQTLPTDNFTPPSRSQFFLGGNLEGHGSADVPPDRPQPPAAKPVDKEAQPDAAQQPAAQPSAGGFEIK